MDGLQAGVVLYTCLYGIEPFYARKEEALREANKAGELTLPPGGPGGLSDEAEDLVSHAQSQS